jgi:metallophosphoesterase (TIGR03767 family)
MMTGNGGPFTTLQRTLGPGPARSAGTEGQYRQLVYGPGEPRLVRDDLAGDLPGRPGPEAAPLAGGKPLRGTELVSLLHVGHLTDIQLADVQSPGRLEFFEKLRGRPGAECYLPACRPQEALVAHAVAAMIKTLNNVAASPETGAPVGLCISTGDSLDNAQLNELEWFLALMGGGTVRTGSGGASYEGVQQPGWEPGAFWCPEPGLDPFKLRFGFPANPGLLAQALEAFRSPGLAMPWLSCFGNHDGLVLGTAIPTAAYERVLSGARKPFDLPPGVDPLSMIDEFTSAPELLLGGPAKEVAPDNKRRSVGRREFVEAHLHASGAPAGHGFDLGNLHRGTAYGAFDIDGPVPVRVIVLDTTNMDGHYEGSIGARQCHWLEEKLAEVHGRHFDATGRLVTTGAQDRLVVLASHHGLATMVNERQEPGGPEQDHPRVTAPALEAIVHRYGNVVLWLNGHRHYNDVQPRPDPAHRTGGFWEVSTAAIADWPCQSRLVEVVASGDRELTILCAMLDSGVPADPDQAQGADRLAALHREIASNDPRWDHAARGAPEDRNLALRLPAPFSFG